MYIILKHNPKLKPGKIFIHHITFEVDKEDNWGYPISKRDHNGDPIVKEVTPIAMPYLIDEELAIFHYIQDNKDKIKESSKKESSKTKIKKELVPGEPLKYYTRKDKQYVPWPSKAELYDVSKFEDTLDIFLGMEPFFNRKQEKIKKVR
jgi:hypothetical protein